MNETRNEAQSKCALTNRHMCCFKYVVKGTGKSKLLQCFSLDAAAKNVLGRAGGSPGPSCFALGGICLYDTVVFCSDLRQGVR